MEIIDLKRLHTHVWETRNKIEMNFATPRPDDALRFAVTEAAEVLDAVLRQNPIYTRNHVKVVELEREVAQVAVMLLTALEEGFDWDHERLWKSWPYWMTSYKTAVGNGYRGTAVDWVVSLTADALQEQLWSQARHEREDPWPGESCILQALVAMGDTSVDIGAAVEKELKQMEEKYGMVPDSDVSPLASHS